LLAAAPVLIWLARNAVRSPAESTGMLGWFIWQAVLATGAVAYLAVASAPLRQSDDSSRSHRWGAVAALLAVVVAGVGIEAWSPGGKFAGWAVWYLPLWLLPLAAMLPRTTDAS